MILIESPQNSRFKTLKSLLFSKGIKDEGQYILSGQKLVLEAIKSHPHLIQYEILTSALNQLSPLNSDKVIQLTPTLFKELDVVGTQSNLLILKLPQIPEIDLEIDPQTPEVILPLSDPSNLGAMIRSSVAFGISKIILTKESAHPFLPKAIKASSGACLFAEFYLGPSIYDISSHCLALDGGGSLIQDFKWPKKFRLLVGEEGKGIPQNVPATKLSININPQIESLNATVAMSLALYQWNQNK